MNAFLRSFVLTSLCLVSALLPGTTFAQSNSSGCHSGVCYPKVVYGGYRHVPASHYGYGYVARPQVIAPVILSHRLGTAEIIRARGEANLNNAHARTQHLRADRLLMENSVEVLHTRLERKEINRQERFGHLHAQGERVRKAKRRAAEAERHDAIANPDKLDTVVVERKTGTVRWPLLLRTSHYAKARGPVNRVFHERSLTGEVNPNHYLPLCDWIEKIQDELLANVDKYRMSDYLEAKAFLRELVDEARIDHAPQFDGTRLAIH